MNVCLGTETGSLILKFLLRNGCEPLLPKWYLTNLTYFNYEFLIHPLNIYGAPTIYIPDSF